MRLFVPENQRCFEKLCRASLCTWGPCPCHNLWNLTLAFFLFTLGLLHLVMPYGLHLLLCDFSCLTMVPPFLLTILDIDIRTYYVAFPASSSEGCILLHSECLGLGRFYSCPPNISFYLSSSSPSPSGGWAWSEVAALHPYLRSF